MIPLLCMVILVVEKKICVLTLMSQYETEVTCQHIHVIQLFFKLHFT